MSNDFDFSLEYATEGAPMLIAGVKSAARWRGRDDDGSGVLIEYMGQGVTQLPKALLQRKKPGRQVKKFKSLEEASAFAAELEKALVKLNPGAAKPPGQPEHPGYYLDDERVFSIEIKYSTAFDAMLKKLKKCAQEIRVDKKSSASAVFMEQAGGGRGWILADTSACVLVVVKFLGKSLSKKRVAEELSNVAPGRAQGTVELAGELVAFDSAFAAHRVASANWEEVDFANGANAAFGDADFGHLRVPEQQLPGGAFVKLTTGNYSLRCTTDADLGGAGANVLCLALQ